MDLTTEFLSSFFVFKNGRMYGLVPSMGGEFVAPGL
jgi:hypothetical protein